MKASAILTLTLANCLLFGSSLAQIRMESMSARVGIIRTTHVDPAYDHEFYAIYPEFQIRVRTFHPFLLLSAYWGYWNDGIEEPLATADVITYSRQAHILGIRLTYLPVLIAPAGIVGGIGGHLASTRYVGGHDSEGKPGWNSYREFTTVELGMTADVSIVGPFSLTGEVHYLFPLGSHGTQKGRWASGLGVAFQF